MTDSPQSENVAPLFGSGGRLYQDARDQQKQEMLPPDEMVPDKPEPPARIGKVEAPKPRREWREPVSTAVELAGVGFLIATGFIVTVWLGTLITGICLIVLGVATSRNLGG
jgi:hypothetical protein